MSSLLKQLQKLAIPGQPSLQQIVAKARPSLLFGPKEAADIDIETVYALGTNGLEELINIDQSFSQFETSLFQESCKDFERTVQTAEILQDLDEKISIFLRRLSPYFLLKPAQKCLEWLIRAFRINSFNVDAIMECVLPYYETKLFARMIQLLPLKSHSSMWHWLRPVQKAGSPLSRLTLIQHCISVPSFLAFICDMVPHSLNAHKDSPVSASRVVVSFYSSTVVSVLEADSISEELVSRLLPHLLKGLKSSSLDHRASSYMILSQLVSKASLQEQLCVSLLESIAKHLGPDLLSEGLCCMTLLCHSQRIGRLSKKSLKYLLRLPPLLPALSALSHSHTLTPLLHLLLPSLLDAHFEHLREEAGCHDSGRHGNKAISLIMSLLDEISLDEQLVAIFIGQLLERFVTFCQHSSSGESLGEIGRESLASTIAPLAQSLDAKYPRVMDNALEAAMVSMGTMEPSPNDGHSCSEGEGEEAVEKGAESNSKLKWLHEFVTLSLPGSRHQLLSHSSGTLVLSVHHPDPRVRAHAVKQLGKTLKHRAEAPPGGYDAEFVSSTLLGRLADEEPFVVMAALELGAKILFQLLPTADLIAALTKMVARRRLHRASGEWQSCALRAIGILGSQILLDRAPESVDDVVIALLPLLFVGRHGSQFVSDVASVLMTSALGRTHPLLVGMEAIIASEVWRQGCDGGAGRDPGLPSAATEAVVVHLGKQLARIGPEGTETLVSKLMAAVDSATPEQPTYFMMLAVIGVATTMSAHSPPTQFRLVLSLLDHVWGNAAALEEGNTADTEVPTYLTSVFQLLVQKHPNCPLAHCLLLLWLLNMITEHLTAPQQLNTFMWLAVPGGDTEEQLYYGALLSLFSTLTCCLDERGREGSGVTAGCRDMLQRVLGTHFSGRGSLLRFLAMIWTAPVGLEPSCHPRSRSQSRPASSSTITATIQVRSLAMAVVCLRCLDTPSTLALAGSHCPVVPSLLVPLTSPYKELRDGALACLAILQAATTPQDPQSGTPSHDHHSIQDPYPTTPLLHLVDAICSSRLELSSDPACLQQLLGKFFSPKAGLIGSKLEGSPHLKRRRSGSRSQAEWRARSAILEAVLECLLAHTVTMGAPTHIQCVLLRALADVEHEAKLAGILPLLMSLLDRVAPPRGRGEPMETDKSQAAPLSEEEGLILQLAIACYTPGMAPLLQTRAEALQLLLSLLMSSTQATPTTPPPQELAIKQVTLEFFAALPSPALQQALLQRLIDLLLESQRSKVITMVKECIRKLPLTAELVVAELIRHTSLLGGAEGERPPPTPSKRTRHSKPPPPPPPPHGDHAPSLPWRRLTVVLELIQYSCPTIADCHLLAPHLFSILGRCLEAEEKHRITLEYCQQLLLSALLSLCDHLSGEGVESARALLLESQFNVEQVVQCVRLSTNPQTHHHALLLLGTAATIFSSRVLHNIMPIFTFMGANLLRQDDQYSFRVINRTVDMVIPALIKSGSDVFSTPSLPRRPGRKTPPTTVEGVVTEIIRVFVDAAPHVPNHRRLPLFSHLLSTVGPSEYLHVTLALLAEKLVVQSSVKEQTPKEALLSSSFPLSLVLEFPPLTQGSALLCLMEYITRLPEEKPESASQLRQLPGSITTLFNVAAHTAKQLGQFKSSTLSLIAQLLANGEFISKVSSLNTESLAAIEGTILKLLQCVLGYAGPLARSHSRQTRDTGRTPRGVLLSQAYDIIDKAISLLSTASFLEVVCQLVGETGGDVQRKTMEILTLKLEGGRMHFTQDHDSLLLRLVDALVGVAKEDSTPPVSRQTALYGIKLLTRPLGHKYHPEFVKIAQIVIAMMSEDQLHPLVYSSCLLCVAQLCSSLRPHAIPLLPSLLPCVLGCLEQEHKSQDLLLQSAVTTLTVVVQTLPKFLSSYISDMVLKICQPHLVVSSEKESGQLMQMAKDVRENVAGSVPARTLLPVYRKCYTQAVETGKDSVVALLSMLSSTVAHLPKEEVKTHTSQLTELFMVVLDYRATQTTEPPEEILLVEECCLQAFTGLVVKLSEGSFRPLFLKLLDWATRPGFPKDRAIVFYHLADCVAEKLKSLFLLFAGHIIKNAAGLLDSNHEEKQETTFFQEEDSELAEAKSHQLLGYVLSCLGRCFLHDGGSFLTKERFDTLLHPLVDQVSNCLGGVACYQERVESHLVPCLAQFAVAAGKESLWKPLNYQLLLKSRHSNTQVRFAVLRVLQELYTKLGEEFVVLLPETIPFLAELMEDESVEVEQQTQTVIATIEGILGESIQQYF